MDYRTQLPRASVEWVGEANSMAPDYFVFVSHMDQYETNTDYIHSVYSVSRRCSGHDHNVYDKENFIFPFWKNV